MANAKPLEAAWADLPNGFHDAELQELNVDLAKAEVRMRLEFWTGDLRATTESERDATRLGTLRLQGAISMIIEPPAARYAPAPQPRGHRPVRVAERVEPGGAAERGVIRPAGHLDEAAHPVPPSVAREVAACRGRRVGRPRRGWYLGSYADSPLDRRSVGLTPNELGPLFCEVGDEVEFVKAVAPTHQDGEPTTEIVVGDRYRVAGLVGFGWDLQRLSGEGPLELRLLNSQMKEYVRITRSKR